MAFTYCTNCGEKIDDSVERCPHCNHPKGIDRVYGYDSENFGKKNSNAQKNNNENTQNPYGQGGNPWEGGQRHGGQGGNPWEGGQRHGGQGGNPWEGGQRHGGQGGNPWENGQYGPGGYQPWHSVEKRKISIGLVIFSIINILLGTCCAGSVFGIIGLVFAVTARDATTEAEEIRRKKISLAINIIAVVLTVAFIISFVIAYLQHGDLSAFLPK